jgi:hypothetical protein
MAVQAALFLVSAGTLVFELVLTRIFSVSQFYHFSFLVISLALLGSGASGTLLSVAPGLVRHPVRGRLGWLATGCGVSILGSYLAANRIPFDSYAIAWDSRQWIYLSGQLFALAVPFLFSGLAVGLLLAADPARSNRTYAVNLTGSAAGCLVVLPLLSNLGAERTVLFGAGMALLGAAVLIVSGLGRQSLRGVPVGQSAFVLAALWLIGTWLGSPPDWLALQLSPYKSVFQALLNPDATLVSSRWNTFSRVDVVDSPSIRSLPGLSMVYDGPFPVQMGVAVDGDHLMPITSAAEGGGWERALPEALAFQLRPGGNGLVLQPGGGLAVAVALANGSGRVTVVEPNPLLVRVVREDLGAFTGGLYDDSRVGVQVTGLRSFVRQGQERYDVIQLALNDGYRPVRSGAYSLSEDYRYTVQALAAYMARLQDDGILVMTRWLQSPPSETVRLVAMALEALSARGVERPEAHLVAYRSFQTGVLLVKASAWTDAELAQVTSFCEQLRFDLSYYPGMTADESNRFAVLLRSSYFDAYTELIAAADRRAIYRESEYEITPPTDDRPFFFHFFKWSQAGQVLAELGTSWQPLGGAGYLVLLVLLLMTVVSSAVLILLPLAVRRRPRTARPGPADPPSWAIGVYFGLLGVGFMLVEIPLIQQFILLLDHPTLSLAATLFAVLLYTGLGSLTARRWRPTTALALIAATAAVLPALFRLLFPLVLGWPLAGRLVLSLLGLAPLCFLMGVPFARGLALLESAPARSALIPWAWAINGSCSVVGSVLAAQLALSLGFQAVLLLGAGAYGAAGMVVALVLQRRLNRG